MSLRQRTSAHFKKTKDTTMNHNRIQFAKVDSVALLTGNTIPNIYNMAEGGDLQYGCYQWVWNVSKNPAGRTRDLRFWVSEMLADNGPQRDYYNHLRLEEVIESLLPPEQTEWPAGEVCRLLQIRPCTLTALRCELKGHLRRNCGFYPRIGLVRFLRRRWLGQFAQTFFATRQFTLATAAPLSA
jgi:hypothetical protein